MANPRIVFRLEVLLNSNSIRIAAYTYDATGEVAGRFDLIESSPVIVGALGDLRVANAISGFRALNPGVAIEFLPDAEAINALERAGNGKGYERIAEAFATGKAAA